MHEDVGNFKVSMDDIFLSKIGKTFENIFDYGWCFMLVEVSVFPKARLQISFVTKFSYDIAVTIAGKNFEAFDDIRMVQFFQNIDFWEEEFF